jgi:predicted GH43/DUF377 family glycosyl hydrolase
MNQEIALPNQDGAEIGCFKVHQWRRDENNPILPPGPSSFDIAACMNPFAIRQGDEYYLFYAGGDAEDGRSICLATCRIGEVSNPSAWKRLGPVLSPGGEDAFDSFWCVLPCVHRVGDRWHLYYTGRNYQHDKGLQSFTGIGLAVSDDLRCWKRVSSKPVLSGDGFAEYAGNLGIAGGGRIVEHPVGSHQNKEGKGTLYRIYYTLAVGVPSPDLLVDQAKLAVSADSYDGVVWFNKQVRLRARPEADYENAATIALNVWKTAEGWRAIYAGIGSRFGAYSICEAESQDGIHWHRGAPGENLSLVPQGDGWESQMVEYPNVIEEEGKLRLFYCGNGYGRTGIGTAIAEKL